MTGLRAATAVAVATVVLALGGCATSRPPLDGAPTAAAPMQAWAGRLSLQVPDQPSESFSAGFELRGSAQEGELVLLTPIGSTLGVVRWEPGKAMLRSPARETTYPSLEALITELAGSPIPVAALFDWLRGVESSVPGWRADLAQLADGRITARRFDPPPEANLRVILER